MFKEATGFLLWCLDRFGYCAITMPWGTVYMLPSRFYDDGIREHESVHLEQISRIGATRWALTYLWYNLRYGYKANPYEVEARTKSGVA